MVRGRIRRGSVALVCALIGVAANAGEAHAWENWYCGVLLNSGSWCGDGSNHTYDYNRGNYNGSGSTWVCARLLYADSSSVRANNCYWNQGVNNIGTNTGTLLEAEVKHEDGAARHTIYGYAVA